MEETEGSCRKKRKKTVDETHDDSTLLPQDNEAIALTFYSIGLPKGWLENASVQPSSGIETLSEAACALGALKHDAVEALNQLTCSSAPKGPLQIHDAAARKPLSGAADVMVINDTSNQNLSIDKEDESEIDSIHREMMSYCDEKELVAPMLQRIFDKHKDIARDCKIKNLTIVEPILEMICSFCHKLENASLSDMMESELEDMTLVLENFQHMGFDVEWLSERVKDIYKMKRIIKDCPALSKEKAIKQKEIYILKQKLSAAEAVLVTINVECDRVRQTIRQEYDTLWAKGFRISPSAKSLMYGLESLMYGLL